MTDHTNRIPEGDAGGAVRIMCGDMFQSGAEALVNPVNCDGIMGKGLALQFARLYPGMLRDYQDRCRNPGLCVGELHVHRPGTLTGPRLIVNLPTKDHWRDPSRLWYVRAGLIRLRKLILDERIGSIAIPALGCGLGGLPWPPVLDLVTLHLDDLVGVNVLLYPPVGEPVTNVDDDATGRAAT